MKALLYKENVAPGLDGRRRRIFGFPQLLEQRKRVLQTLELVRPGVVIAMGDLALWAAYRQTPAF